MRKIASDRAKSHKNRACAFHHPAPELRNSTRSKKTSTYKVAIEKARVTLSASEIKKAKRKFQNLKNIQSADAVLRMNQVLGDNVLSRTLVVQNQLLLLQEGRATSDSPGVLNGWFELVLIVLCMRHKKNPTMRLGIQLVSAGKRAARTVFARWVDQGDVQATPSEITSMLDAFLFSQEFMKTAVSLSELRSAERISEFRVGRLEKRAHIAKFIPAERLALKAS